MYSLKDVMNMLKIPERTIRRHIKEGLLVGRKIGGAWQFNQNQIEDYLAQSKVQKHIKDEGIKDITDFYRINVEDKSEVIYMLIKQFSDISTVKKFLEVTKSFNYKFTINCSTSGNHSCFTFKGQPEDVTILMKWSHQFDKQL